MPRAISVKCVTPVNTANEASWNSQELALNYLVISQNEQARFSITRERPTTLTYLISFIKVVLISDYYIIKIQRNFFFGLFFKNMFLISFHSLYFILQLYVIISKTFKKTSIALRYCHVKYYFYTVNSGFFLIF